MSESASTVNDPLEKKYQENKKWAFWMLIFLTGINFLNYFDRYIVAQLLPYIIKEFDLSLSVAGLIKTTFIVVYSFACPIFGAIGVKYARKYLISFGVGFWSLATIMAGRAGSFATFMIWRSMVGVGEASYAPIAPGLIADLFPKRLRGRRMAFFFMVTPVGAACGYLLGGLLAESFGWRTTLLIAGAPGILLAFVVLKMREPERGAYDGEAARKTLIEAPDKPKGFKGAVLAYWDLRNHKRYVFAALGYTAYTYAVGAFQWWMPYFFDAVHKIPRAESGITFGAITVVGGVVGALTGGQLADKLRGKIKNPYFTITWVSSALSFPFVMMALMVDPGPLMWGSILIAEIFIFINTGPINIMLINAVPLNQRATAVALAVFMIHCFGDAISPPIVGFVSQLFGMRIGLLMIPGALLVGSLLWFIGSKFKNEFEDEDSSVEATADP